MYDSKIARRLPNLKLTPGEFAGAPPAVAFTAALPFEFDAESLPGTIPAVVVCPVFLFLWPCRPAAVGGYLDPGGSALESSTGARALAGGIYPTAEML